MIGVHVGTLGPEHFLPVLAVTIDQRIPNHARPRDFRGLNLGPRLSLRRGSDPVGSRTRIHKMPCDGVNH